jgi:predicted enzyme related to lactoylglutathione lyase
MLCPKRCARKASRSILSVIDCDYGRFAWIMDPEGNRIKLWESPKA